MSPLVTIITPVYNGQEFIERLLNSILMQNYPNLQFIIVDDGSVDCTKEIIFSYIDKFKQKNIDFKYIYQNNSGQSYALKNALKYVNGEYLTWPDSDDYYYKEDCITKLVQPLIKNHYKISRCLPIFFNENLIYFKDEKKSIGEDIFEECLYAKQNFWFQPGCYMINYRIYQEINPNLNFYCERETGQNWQFYLPILYKYKCYTIQESLFAVFERKDSHSRVKYYDIKKIEKKYNSYINTLSYTLKIINIEDKLYKTYMNNIRNQYYVYLFNEALLIERNIAKDILKKYHKYFSNKIKLYLKVSIFFIFYKKIMNFIGVY